MTNTFKNKWAATSPSQLSTFQDCKRKWWRISVNGERQPPTAAAERGSRVHEQLENYLMYGEQCTDGTALAMLEHLPSAGTVRKDFVEVAFSAMFDFAVPIRGRVDLLEPPNMITDHKTTSNLNFAKSESDLRTDSQAIIYTAAAMAGELGDIEFRDKVTFRLVYGTTKGRTQTRVVQTTFERPYVIDQLGAYKQTIDDQLKTSDALDWEDVQPNYASCDKYGGCPFAQDCLKVSRPKTSEFISIDALAFKAPEALQKTDKLEHSWLEPSAGFLSIDLDTTGQQYENANPPDGLPDGAPLPDDQKPKPKKINYTWNGLSISTMKAKDAKDCLKELIGTLDESQIEYYREKINHLTKSTLSENKQRIKAALEAQRYIGEKKMDGWNHLFNRNKVQETKAPAQETKALEIKAPVQETKAPAQEMRMLLVDAHCTGAVELEQALYPLIQEIEQRAKQPIGLIEYGKGWQMLSALINEQGWTYGPIARIDSQSLIYKNCSYILNNICSLCIRSTR